jgi:hypothetical protein
MKKIIASLLFCLVSLVSWSQEISLPVSVVDSIIIDLARYDILKVEYSKLDSVVSIQTVELATRKQELKEAKLTVDQYKMLVQKLEKSGQITEKELKKANNKIRWLKIAHVLRTVGEVAIIIIIVVI